MKTKLLVVFCSKHGYVKRYVDIIGNELGCDAVPVEKLADSMLAAYDKILYIGSLRGDEINGMKKFNGFLDAIYGKTVVCGVGLTPFRHYMPRRIKEASISVTYEKFIPVFYAQGGFDVDELSRTEKFSVAWRARQIKSASLINDDDTFFMNAMSAPVDEVKKANIKPLLEYLEGKEVDAKLYSPPEITDPDEIKQFFAEQEEAAKAPDDKKRALKKKLKGKLGGSSDTQSDDEKRTEDPTQTEVSAAEEKMPEETPSDGNNV